jgi:hypothetical protein
MMLTRRVFYMTGFVGRIPINNAGLCAGHRRSNRTLHVFEQLHLDYSMLNDRQNTVLCVCKAVVVRINNNIRPANGAMDVRIYIKCYLSEQKLVLCFLSPDDIVMTQVRR